MINTRFGKILVLTGWTIYLYVTMEWLFFATIPSFMSTMNALEKAEVLLLSAFIVAVPLLLITALLAAFSTKAAAAAPALVLSALSLILLDNFTYTIFKFGIVTSRGIGRFAYGIAFMVVFITLWRKIASWLGDGVGQLLQKSGYALLLLLGISTVTFFANLQQFHLPEEPGKPGSVANLPSIILIGVDGMNADHMSAYGYERDTTPNIAGLADQALVVENAFSNAGKTGGSLTSMLTGKPTTETRVLFPPDILLGKDAYQHLPGILKQHGYHTVQITMQYYGDAYERNILGGFDVVNGRVAASDPLVAQLASLGGGGGVYLTGQMLSRMTQRLGHIFFIRQMQNPYAAVTQPEYALHDDRRMAEMFQYIDESDSPLFLHIHLMDTHGPEFYVPHPFFARPGEANKDWNLDYYDDAIRGSDQNLKDLFDHLEKTGKRDNTLIILYSDHGINWSTLDRVPLMFWFPGQEYVGTVQSNVQLLDVAPTILDYANIAQPIWMTGRSILGDLPPSRPIFSAIVNDRLLRVTDDRKTWVIDETKIQPPFYQLGTINLIICSRWYSLHLDDASLTDGDVAGSTASCHKQDIPTEARAAEMIIDYLKDERYDASSLMGHVLARGPQP